MKVLFLLSLRLNSDETRVDGEIWVGKCNRIKDSWAIKFGYLRVPRGPSPMPDLGILLYEVPIKCGCFGYKLCFSARKLRARHFWASRIISVQPQKRSDCGILKRPEYMAPYVCWCLLMSNPPNLDHSGFHGGFCLILIWSNATVLNI